ncbi:MAG: glutaredoxin domain-containing protein [Verrucomicrobiota bacterium]
MSAIIPRLFVKTGCPWCIGAIDFLNQHQIEFEEIVVSSDPTAMEEMVKLSGQTKAPTMDWNGEILADFGVEELEPFLKERHAI